MRWRGSPLAALNGLRREWRALQLYDNLRAAPCLVLFSGLQQRERVAGLMADLGVLADTLPGYYGLAAGSWAHWARVWEEDLDWLKGRFAMLGDKICTVRAGRWKLHAGPTPKERNLSDDWIDPRAPDGETIFAQKEQARPSEQYLQLLSG